MIGPRSWSWRSCSAGHSPARRSRHPAIRRSFAWPSRVDAAARRSATWHPTRRLSCPSVIVAINEPATLRVLHDARLPLSGFVVRHEPWRTGPASQLTTGPIVDAADGGGGEQWVCHQGAWLVRVHH